MRLKFKMTLKWRAKGTLPTKHGNHRIVLHESSDGKVYKYVFKWENKEDYLVECAGCTKALRRHKSKSRPARSNVTKDWSCFVKNDPNAEHHFCEDGISAKMMPISAEEQQKLLLSLFSQVQSNSTPAMSTPKTVNQSENPRKRPREDSKSPKPSTPAAKHTPISHPFPTPSTGDSSGSLGYGMSPFFTPNPNEPSTSTGFGIGGFPQTPLTWQRWPLLGPSSYQHTPSNDEIRRVKSQMVPKKERKEERERHRRERINKSTLQLRDILMEAIPNEATKLEKGDIYELTITYIRRLEKQVAQMKKEGKAVAPDRSSSPENVQQHWWSGYMVGCADASRYFAQLILPITTTTPTQPPQMPFQMPLGFSLPQFPMMPGASTGFPLEPTTSAPPLFQVAPKLEAEDQGSTTSSMSANVKVETPEPEETDSNHHPDHRDDQLVIDEEDDDSEDDSDAEE